MKIPEREKPQKKVINKGFLRDLEGYEQSDKNLFHLPRQHIKKSRKTLINKGFLEISNVLLHTNHTRILRVRI